MRSRSPARFSRSSCCFPSASSSLCASSVAVPAAAHLSNFASAAVDAAVAASVSASATCARAVSASICAALVAASPSPCAPASRAASARSRAVNAACMASNASARSRPADSTASLRNSTASCSSPRIFSMRRRGLARAPHSLDQRVVTIRGIVRTRTGSIPRREFRRLGLEPRAEVRGAPATPSTSAARATPVAAASFAAASPLRGGDEASAWASALARQPRGARTRLPRRVMPLTRSSRSSTRRRRRRARSSSSRRFKSWSRVGRLGGGGESTSRLDVRLARGDAGGGLAAFELGRRRFSVRTPRDARVARRSVVGRLDLGRGGGGRLRLAGNLSTEAARVVVALGLRSAAAALASRSATCASRALTSASRRDARRAAAMSAGGAGAGGWPGPPSTNVGCPSSDQIGARPAPVAGGGGGRVGRRRGASDGADRRDGVRQSPKKAEELFLDIPKVPSACSTEALRTDEETRLLNVARAPRRCGRAPDRLGSSFWQRAASSRGE